MNTLLKTKALIISILISTFQLSAQMKWEVKVANWPNNATAAYSIIHDDFGNYNARGIQDFADSICFKKHLRFTTAAIVGSLSEAHWKIADTLVAHGHQIVNHTMSHKCGKEIDWCKIGTWNEKDFHYEIDTATQKLNSHLHKNEQFMIFPFDLFTDTMLTYVKNKNYLGARAGLFNEVNPTQFNPFKLNFTEHFPQDNPDSTLYTYLHKAISNKAWAVQTFHGVEDDSWGKLSLKQYQKLTDTLQFYQESNKLFVGTLSEVYHYRKLADSLKTNVNVLKNGFEITLNLLNPAQFSTKKITLIIPNEWKKKTFIQSNNKIKPELINGENTLIINPFKGNISVRD